MPFIPAVCGECYTVFSSGLFVKDAHMDLSGYPVDPCPDCQVEGYVRSGLNKFVSYTISILDAEERNVLELNTLYDALILAKDDELQPDHLEVIIKCEMPSFLNILLLLPRTKEDYKLCLNLLIQIISAVIDISIQTDKASTRLGKLLKIHQDLKVNQVIDQIYTNNTGVERRLF